MTSDMHHTAVTVEELEQRLSDLARNKSRLELINRLLTSLSSVAGLENMLQHILDILMQTIGAANISIIFRLDDTWQYRDIFGENRLFRESGNPDAAKVLATGHPLKISTPGMQSTDPGGADSAAVENWIFPLLSQERIVGAICLDGMQLVDASIYNELQPFIVYAGVMLDNEISNYSRMAEAHRRLQDSETLYRTLFEQSPDGIVLWGVPVQSPIRFNTAAHTLLGYSREEFATLTVADFEVMQGEMESHDIMNTLRREGAASFESVHRTRTGENRSMLISLKMIGLEDQKMILAIHRDITEHKKAEEALRGSEERFRSIMALSPDIISIIGANGDLMYNSPAAFSIHGYTQEEMLGQNTLGLIHPDDQEQVSHAFHEVLETPFQTITTQYRYRNKDGSYIWMECSACNQISNPLINGIIAISRTIADRKKMEEERLALERQLLHAQKLESLGVLAGGIAHDFNNILTAIVGNASLALIRVNKESPAVENLYRIEEAATRAADLAKQMLAYSGKGKFVVDTIDLNLLLEEMLHMLEVSISKKAVLRLNQYHPLPPVEADATQMRQIIMNLVINASEAIGDKSGVIAITTGCMDCDRNYLKDVWLDENLTDGLYVYLEIADTGCGMDSETLSKLFDPFFTTKFTGRGLGMAAVLGIVRGHKGAIKVYSEPGRGTTFKILLPASGRPAETFNGTSGDDAWQGSGTVLLVDDEETIRGIGAEMLKELGFTVVTAADGREAVDIFTSRHDISFVILDLTMPHMDGEQCFRELRQIKPDVRVIMSSGYNEQEVTQKFIGKGLAGFIQKPYRLSTLKEAVRGVV